MEAQGMIERIEFEGGKLDEIVVAGGAHLESMGGGDWFLELFKDDGTSIAIWFYSKSLTKPNMEIRPACADSSKSRTGPRAD